MEHIYSLVWLVGFVLLLIGCGAILGESIRSRTIRTIFIPGFLLTAGLQLLFCEVGRVDKRRVSVVSERIPSTLRYEGLSRTKRLFMIMAPFTSAFVILALLLWLLDVRVRMFGDVDESLPALFVMTQRFGYTLTDVIVYSLHLVFTAVVTLIEKGNPFKLLTLYVVISLLFAMIPPKKEGRRLLIGFAVMGGLLWIVSLALLKMDPAMVFPRKLDSVCATAAGFAFWILVALVFLVWLPRWLSEKRRREEVVGAEEA